MQQLPLNRTPSATVFPDWIAHDTPLLPRTRRFPLLTGTIDSHPLRSRVALWMEVLQDHLTRFFEESDRGGRFREDLWDRPGGGSGVSRLLSGGQTFEKVGVNRYTGGGPIDRIEAERLSSRTLPEGEIRFFATGVSVVCHPVSPMVPIVHMNVRYFELEGPDGERLDHWFGGGLDLTPTHPFPEDAVHFHRTLKDVCDRRGPSLYSRFKEWCDQYFVIHHRHGELRGVGGIFFDNLRTEVDGTMEVEELFSFVRDVGFSLAPAYGPLVEARRDTPWGPREKELQMVRRGRYVEFNLVHDRGTRFGLLTNARIESVLMSMPPVARWEYDVRYEPGSFEMRLVSMLRPHDWASGVPPALADQSHDHNTSPPQGA